MLLSDSDHCPSAQCTLPSVAIIPLTCQSHSQHLLLLHPHVCEATAAFNQLAHCSAAPHPTRRGHRPSSHSKRRLLLGATAQLTTRPRCSSCSPPSPASSSASPAFQPPPCRSSSHPPPPPPSSASTDFPPRSSTSPPSSSLYPTSAAAHARRAWLPHPHAAVVRMRHAGVDAHPAQTADRVATSTAAVAAVPRPVRAVHRLHRSPQLAPLRSVRPPCARGRPAMRLLRAAGRHLAESVRGGRRCGAAVPFPLPRSPAMP